MNNEYSQATQDYLKIIYKLNNRYGRAATSQIAEELEITPASVTGMLQKMAQAQPPLLEYRKHHGVTLTAAGERAALEIIRHHRLLELFLVKTLGYTWDEVHEEAERLEHVISEEMEQRIANFLGNPKTDPHGHPIPSSDLEMLSPGDSPLCDLRPPQRVVIRRVRDDDDDLLRYLERMGLKLNTELTILDYVPFDGNLHVQVGGREKAIVLGAQVSENIFVDLMPTE
ncbi:MAG: metal-dependent transcriptional regulator [Anaerolineae bacterium]